MKLKHSKKYETADGVVYRVRKHPKLDLIWDVSDDNGEHWDKNGKGFGFTDLIRRHYTKPQPAHKLGLKEGDVVELVAWEDQDGCLIGKRITVDMKGLPDRIGIYGLSYYPKGHRPLFRVVSRA